MKYVGKIDDIIYDGKFLVRTNFKPKIGTRVVNKRNMIIGKITQIIGPIKNPYITIKPQKDLKSTFQLIGMEIYIK
jgi:rRNA processing protein Gar1